MTARRPSWYLDSVTRRPARRRRRVRRDRGRFPWGPVLAGLLLAGAAAGSVAAVRALRARGRPDAPRPGPPPPAAPAALRPLRYTWPTDRRRLDAGESPAAFMPTASGRVESALCGSTRTARRGGSLGPAFHEGVDIAPVARDRAGNAADTVFAVADGTVGYVNRVGGNSSYGIYVALLHADPLGPVYSLYAHLASAAPGLRAGMPIRAGERLGTMGHTSTLGIPRERGHLHLEIGLVANRRFPAWFRARKLTPDHGMLNGGNLLGIDPLAVLGGLPAQPEFDLAAYLARQPPAFRVVCRAPRPIDYFERYPGLWQGARAEPGDAVVLAATEGGVVLAGRRATDGEARALGREKTRVADVDAEALGRNGRRLLAREGAAWKLGRNGEDWLDILLF